MQKIKKAFSFCLVLLFVLCFSACFSGDKGNTNYFYFEKSVIELYVGDSQNILLLEHQANVNKDELVLIASENIEVNGLTFSAIAKGDGYVYVCYKGTRLCRIEIRVYQSQTQEEEDDEEPLSYEVVSQIDGFYVVDIKKDGEPYTNFIYECENSDVEINVVNGNTLYIYAPSVSSFSITIKDKENFSSLIIILPSE